MNNRYLEYNWTKTHGFFTIMGGFMEYHDGPPTVIKAKCVPEVMKRQTLEVQIQDRSKGDALKKTFALVQTLWFIVQCTEFRNLHSLVEQTPECETSGTGLWR